VRISEEYRALNRKLHESIDFGSSGHKYAKDVMALVEEIGSRDVLDYGAGKGTLAAKLPFPIAEYDPSVPGLEESAEPADVVVCTDVLEHIEPECLDDVLSDLRRVTRNTAYFVIATRPALKELPDGRNAHLIQESLEWWSAKLAERFELVRVKPDDEGDEVRIWAK
jgi:hypothetical protein